MPKKTRSKKTSHDAQNQQVKDPNPNTHSAQYATARSFIPSLLDQLPPELLLNQKQYITYNASQCLYHINLEVTGILSFLNQADLDRLALVCRALTPLARHQRECAPAPALDYSELPQMQMKGVLPIKTVTTLPSGLVVEGFIDGTLREWNPMSQEYKLLFKAHQKAITLLAALPDGRLVSCTDTSNPCVWNLDTQRCDLELVGHTSPVSDLAVVSAQRLITSSYDCSLRVWDLQTGRCKVVLRNAHNDRIITSVALVRTRPMLAVSGSTDHTLRLWNLSSGRFMREYRGHEEPINSITLLPNGRVVSASNDRTLRIWDLNYRQSVRILRGHEKPIETVYMAQDGCMASRTDGGMVCIWRFPEKSVKKTTIAEDDPITQLQRTNNPAQLITTLYSFNQFVERINHTQPVTASGHTFRSLLTSLHNQRTDYLINLADQQNERNYAYQHGFMFSQQTKVSPDLEHMFHDPRSLSYSKGSYSWFFSDANRDKSYVRNNTHGVT